MIHSPHITAAPATAAPLARFAGRMAFDGFHQNDPDAPPAWRCWSCDGYMHGQRGYCAGCDAEVTCWFDQPETRS